MCTKSGMDMTAHWKLTDEEAALILKRFPSRTIGKPLGVTRLLMLTLFYLYRYGFGASIFTKNSASARKFQTEIEAGQILHLFNV
ncbi:hypothetical protein Tco_0268637 [Tanacetum coccineum]